MNTIKEHYNYARDGFMYLLSYAKELHLPNKLVNFDRTKHRKSKWITNGILKSINTKDKLYKALVQADSMNTL